LKSFSGGIDTKKAAEVGASPLLWGAGIGTLVASVPHHNIAGVIAAGVGLVLTGTGVLSFWSMMRTGKNVTPFLAANGHVVNVEVLRADDL
jgi:hypothetical protein